MSKLIQVTQKSDNRLQFHLTNDRISYIFQNSEEGVLEHCFFGAAIEGEGLAAATRRAFRCTTLEFEGVQNYNLTDVSQEYPTFGRSDTRYPALHVCNGDGNTTNTLSYHSYQILDTKPELPGLPSSRSGESETLIVSLLDKVSALRVDLQYTVFAQHDVIARACTVYNEGQQDVQLHNVMSSALDLPANEYEVIHFNGSWGREFNLQRKAVGAGRFEIASSSGASGNIYSPFLAIAAPGTSEQSGEVIATTLMYSGNFSISVEQNEFASVRILAGINPFNFSWQLKAGESFTTPECLQVYSAKGLDGMSQIWHAFIRKHISPPQHCASARPTYLNSWEAAYFEINESKVIDLAHRAKALGLEMLVVDDGWFKGRDDDTTSLGDWSSDERKFPRGIEAVAAEVKKMGLKFGLWFEPEMVNENSDLFRAHPDWIIHVPHRIPSTGRQQLILDLSRPEVVEHLYNKLDGFLSGGKIDYIKWDMNRIMTEIGSAGLPASQQQETAHRYLLGVYDLIKRLVTKYPKVLFENCASGGNRFDLGLLRYMAQGWVSDMSEPIGRLPIITGASYLYPPSVLASYIGPIPSHQNDRLVSLKTRAEVGFFCAARGMSLDFNDIEGDQSALQEVVKWYKRTANDLVSGMFHRLFYSANQTCWQLNSADNERIYIGYFHILSAPNLPYRRARLTALQPSARYRDKRNGNIYAGDALMNMGIDLPYVHALQLSKSEDYMPKGDFSSCVIELVKQ